MDPEYGAELHALFGQYKLSSYIIYGSPVYELIQGDGFLYKCTNKTYSHASWRVLLSFYFDFQINWTQNISIFYFRSVLKMLS